MNPPVPGFLFPYMLLGSLATITALLFGLNRSLTLANWSTHDRRRTVRTAAALLAAFYLAALITARLGFYAGLPNRIPTIQIGLLIPIALGILFFLRWPAFRRVIEAIPQQWLVGLQFFRTEGLVFLLLYAAGRLPGAFAIPAGVGDLLVGLFAPLVAIAYLRRGPISNARIRTWNFLGLLDLAIALTTGFLTSPSPIQLLALDQPNLLIARYPLVMIPTFLVPLAILLHLASLQRLRQTEPVQSTRRPIVLTERG